MRTKHFIAHVLTIFLAVGLVACSDNGSGTEAPEPPAIPELEYAQPDVSYFGGFGFPATNQETEVGSEPNNFAAAQALVLGFSSFSMIGQLYTDLLSNTEDATFNDGVWEWVYEYDFEEISSRVRLTAEEADGAVNWEVFSSVEGAGVDLDEKNVMSGSTRNDGLQGEWTFNSFFEESETPLLSSEWTAESDTERQLHTVIYGDIFTVTGEFITEIDFIQSGSEFLMNIDFPESEESIDTEIFWNIDANIGYILTNGEKKCWQGRGQEAVDVLCSDVGL